MFLLGASCHKATLWRQTLARARRTSANVSLLQRGYASALDYMKDGKKGSGVATSTAGGSKGALAKRGKTETNVVIIGGGVVGVSIAYHLGKRGAKDVVLLEKSDLTAGSTWHAAGLTTYFHPSINPKKIHHYSIRLYEKLEEETGQNVGLHKPGSVRLLSTPERMEEAKYQMTRAHWNPAEQYLIDKEQVMELVPLVNRDKILGGIYTPNDGHIDPYSLTQALAIGARKNGVEIYQNTPVKGLKVRKSDGRFEVITDQGTLIAKHLVNAAGFWAREVGQMLNIDFPIVPVHHQYVITAAIPEVADLKTELPVIRDLEASYYLRQERKGLLFGPYETVDRMELCEDWIKKGVPQNFGKELFPPNLERIMPNVEMAMEMVPVLQNAQIHSIINGPITYNCENAPLLGPYQGLQNHWLAVGFGYGVIQAGGAGRYLADYIVDGEPPHELSDLDANRYGWWCSTDFALAKARETYGLNNLLGHPKEERWTGRPTSRCSPLYEDLKQRGAEFGFHNGWEQPHWFARTPQEQGYKPSFRRTNWFSSLQRECDLVYERVGITDLTPFSKYRIHGPKAGEFLDRMKANSLPKVGTTCISHMLTPKARVYAEVTVSCLAENEFLVVTGSGVERHDLWWLERHAHEMGYTDRGTVQIQNVTDSLGVLGVAGPESRSLLSALTEEDLNSSAWPFLHCRRVKVANVPVTAIRISYSGELGWELYCDMKDIVTLYRALHSAGKKWGVDDFGSFAMNSMRIEKGFRMWGNDMNKDTNPFESGLGIFVKVKKPGDFIGKVEATKIKEAGLKRQIVHLVIEGTQDVDPEGNETLWLDNKVVGNTTSGSYSTRLKTSLAMAFLPKQLAQEGNVVQVELQGKKYDGRVLLQPPVKIQPQREREEMLKKKH